MVGCTDGSGEAWRSRGSQARGSVEVPIRGTHRGLRSLPTAHEAGHMTASNPLQQTLNITLAGRGPSTHATSRRPRAPRHAPAGRRRARRCRAAWRRTPGRVERLKVRTRCGCRPCAAQIRCTEAGEMPISAAIAAHRPVRRLARRRRQRQRHHPLDHRPPAGGLPRPGLVAQQPVDPGLEEALLPAPHAGLGLPGPAHDRHRPAARPRAARSAPARHASAAGSDRPRSPPSAHDRPHSLQR